MTTYILMVFTALGAIAIFAKRIVTGLHGISGFLRSE